MATLDKAEALLEELRAASWDAAQQVCTCRTMGPHSHILTDLCYSLSLDPPSCRAYGCTGAAVRKRCWRGGLGIRSTGPRSGSFWPEK